MLAVGLTGLVCKLWLREDVVPREEVVISSTPSSPSPKSEGAIVVALVKAQGHCFISAVSYPLLAPIEASAMQTFN